MTMTLLDGNVTTKRPRGQAWLAFTLCGLLLPIAPSAAQTNVPGGFVGNTTWTRAGSPYIVLGDIQVSLLRIGPGVVVLLAGPYQIEVLSTIVCAGTAQDPIVFRPQTAGQAWRGLKFRGTPTGSSFTGCVIEAANERGVTLSNCQPPTFTDCTFRLCSSPGYGGAIDADGVTTNLVLTRCSFLENSSASHGGAVRVNATSAAAVLIDKCVFLRNVANPSNAGGEFVGGALWLQGGAATIAGSEFRDNRSNSACYSSFSCVVVARGGAVHLGSSERTTMSTTVFTGNIASAYNGGNCSFSGGATHAQGGAVFVAAGAVEINNCVMARNLNLGVGRNCNPSHAGGGVLVNAGTTTITNSTIARNPSTTGLYGVGGTLDVSNSIVYDNNGGGPQIGGTANVTYSDVQGGWTGTGNINFNPVFDGPACELIQVGSPCIDAGDPAANDSCIVTATRPFGPALGATRNDMGAHGGPRACEWVQANPRVLLTAQPESVTTPGPVTFTALGGDPRTPVGLYLTGLNSSPIQPCLVGLNVFCPDWRRPWAFSLPALPPMTLNFRAYALDGNVQILTSNEITVTIR